MGETIGLVWPRRIASDGILTPGVDVSHWQRKVDWNTLAGMGKKFAFVKATGGIATKDPLFDEHRTGARMAGLVTGAYFFYKCGLSPSEQVFAFLDATQGVENGELPHVVDVEWNDGILTLGKYRDDLLRFLELLEQATKMTPIIYTAASFFTGFRQPELFHKYPLWIANYGVAAPLVPAPWTHWHFWQTSENGQAPGGGKIDLNVFNGSYSELLRLTRQT